MNIRYLPSDAARDGLAALAAAVAVFAVWLGAYYFKMPGVPDASVVSQGPAPMDWPQPAIPTPSVHWAVFAMPSVQAMPAVAGRLAALYRLAGTFFAQDDRQHTRRAILDMIGAGRQIMLGEGEHINDTVLVVRIARDRVLLRDGNTEEELTLSFAGVAPAEGMGRPGAADAPQDASLESRFGRKIEADRWVLTRQGLLEYYQELLNDPDRLASVFESLKPVYDDQHIAGYTLDVEGEAEMFKAFGLQEGDIVRMVNSMPMTSQVRAEYFIREFVEDRVNAFVLDIERDGKPSKLVYLVR